MRVFTTIILILLVSHLTGLCSGFANIAVLPNNPSTNDSVRLFYTYYTMNRPANIFTHQIVTSDSIVQVNICFGMGQQTAGAILHDTINLGVYSTVGTYHVTLYMNLTSLQDTLCNNSIWYDSAQTIFTVMEPSAIAEINSDEIIVRPNPVREKIGFQGLSSAGKNLQCAVFTTEGQQIIPPVNILNVGFELDVSKLLPAVYFLQLQDEKHRWVKKFVKY